MEDVNDGGIPSVFLLQLLSLKIIQYFSLLIPISLFFGIIIALNKLYVSNEMVIMKVNGYSNKLISTILTRMIVITAIIVMLFNCFITPHDSAWGPRAPQRAVDLFLENYKRFKSGEKLINKV